MNTNLKIEFYHDKKTRYRAKILNQASYLLQGINGNLYDAIINYMEQHNLKQKDLAKHLGISPSRVSQILNDGEMNFSIEKIIQIALKVDKFHVFEFEDKTTFLVNESKPKSGRRISKKLKKNFAFIDLPHSTNTKPAQFNG